MASRPAAVDTQARPLGRHPTDDSQPRATRLQIKRLLISLFTDFGLPWWRNIGIVDARRFVSMITSARCALPSLTAVSKSISVVRTPAEVGLPAPVAARTDSKDTFSRHLCLDHLGDFGCAVEANKVSVV